MFTRIRPSSNGSETHRGLHGGSLSRGSLRQTDQPAPDHVYRGPTPLVLDCGPQSPAVACSVSCARAARQSDGPLRKAYGSGPPNPDPRPGSQLGDFRLRLGHFQSRHSKGSPHACVLGDKGEGGGRGLPFGNPYFETLTGQTGQFFLDLHSSPERPPLEEVDRGRGESHREALRKANSRRLTFPPDAPDARNKSSPAPAKPREGPRLRSCRSCSG
jgi:hypothetical protein